VTFHFCCLLKQSTLKQFEQILLDAGAPKNERKMKNGETERDTKKDTATVDGDSYLSLNKIYRSIDEKSPLEEVE